MKKYYLEILTNKYSDFDGRARRKEYWMWTLYYTIILLLRAQYNHILRQNSKLYSIDHLITFSAPFSFPVV